MLIGIVGKPSSGKSTFLNAACLTNAKIGNYPFTTIDPNLGTGYLRVKCVCEELGVKDNPKNSQCLNHVRFIPIKLLDVAGLVPDAHLGKGLGNQFLSDLSKADALLHILDISGETDSEGKEIVDGSHDPMDDIRFLEREIDLWFKDILLRKDWNRFANRVTMEKLNFVDLLYDRLSGLSIRKIHIIKAIDRSKLNPEKPEKWTEADIERFSHELRQESKPFLIIANKIDKKHSEANYNRVKNELHDRIIPASALAEFYLRKYAESGVIEYYPGDSSFKIVQNDKLKENEKKALSDIDEKIIKKYGSTGIQMALQQAVFNLLNNIIVYPVYDEKKYTDKDGNVLPDAYIVPNEMAVKDFVNEKVHSDLAKNFIYAIDGRTKMRLGEGYKLKNNDIIKVVSAAKSK